MFLQSTFVTEYLAESNLVLTQEDFGNKLYDLLSPIRNLLHADKDILAFCLARYAGAPSRLAFFSQWFAQTQSLLQDNSPLFQETQQYLRKRVPIRLRGVPNLYELVDRDVAQVYLPMQQAFLQNKTRELTQDILVKHDYLSKYLSPTFQSRFTAAEMVSGKFLYSENLSIKEFLDAQAYRSSYHMVCYPTLLGLLHTYHQPDNPVNPKSIKWILLEEILEQIAILHQTGTNRDLAFFMYLSRLNDKEQFIWLQEEPKTQIQTLRYNSEVHRLVQESRQKIHTRATDLMQNLVLPDKDMIMLKDLLDWSLAQNLEEAL